MSPWERLAQLRRAGRVQGCAVCGLLGDHFIRCPGALWLVFGEARERCGVSYGGGGYLPTADEQDAKPNPRS